MRGTTERSKAAAHGRGGMKQEPSSAARGLTTPGGAAIQRMEQLANRNSQVKANAKLDAAMNGRTGVVQRTEIEALDLAKLYSGRTYTAIDDLVEDKARFSSSQWREIVTAYNKGNSGPRLRFVDPESGREPEDPSALRDRSGNVVKDQKLNQDELSSLVKAKEAIQGTAYETFLVYLEGRVRKNLGMVGFQQLYRGGHIVFNDGGTVYKELVALSMGLAKPRYTGKSQTSHYTAKGGYDTSIEDKTPQMGLDLPSPLTGHILFGIVAGHGKRGAGGDTFVQTEMYGFQDFHSTYIGHGMGFAVSASGYGNSGLVGYSPHSEKEKRELREVDNT